MRRWLAYLLSLIFLLGLVVLDLGLLMDRTKLKARLDHALKSNVKANVSYEDINFDAVRNLRLTAVITKVQLFNERDRDRSSPVLTCDRLEVSLDWRSVFKGRPEIDRISLIRPVVSLEWDESGRLDIPSIVTSSDTKSRATTIPPIRIEDMDVRVKNAPHLDPKQAHVLSGIWLELAPRRSTALPYSVQGRIDDPVFGRFAIDGAFGTAELRGTIRRDDFQLDRNMVACLDENLRGVLDAIAMDGVLDLAIELEATDFHDVVDIKATAKARDVSLQYRDWPTRISNLNGLIRYERGKIETEALDFAMAGGHVKVNRGEVDLTTRKPEFSFEGQAVQIALNEHSVREFASYPEPGPTIAQVLEAISANGTVDVDFDLRQEEPYERVLVRIQVMFREASLCFIGFPDAEGVREGFPYPLEHVLGTVIVSNDELVFRDIRSQVKLPDVSAQGTITYGRRGFSLDIDINGNNLRLDEKVRSCLSEAHRKIWDSYQPDGPVNFNLAVTRANEESAHTELDLEVHLRGIGAMPRLFPYALEDVEGTLIFGGAEGTQVKNVVARHGPTNVTINGTVDMGSTVAEPAYALNIRAQDAIVDRDLLEGVRAGFPDIAAEIERFHFQGAVDFNCDISSSEESANRYEVTLKDLAFEYENLPGVTFRDLRGRMVAQGNRLQIENATMTWRGNVFTATGWLDVTGEKWHDILVRANELILDDTTLGVATSLVPDIASLTRHVQIDGSIGVRFHLLANNRGSGIRSEINALGLVVSGREVPFRIQDVYGTMSIADSRVDLESWTGTIPFGAEPEADDEERIVITFDSGVIAKYKGVNVVDITGIDIQNVTFAHRVLAMLPEDLRSSITALGAKGSFDAHFDKLNLHGDEPSFVGSAKLQLMTFDPGFAIEVPQAVVDIEGVTGKNGAMSLSGRLRDGTMTLGPFHLSDVSSRYVYANGGITFDEIRAGVVDGSLNPEGTSFKVDFVENHPFEVTLSLSDGRLSKLVEEFGGNPTRLEGRFSTSMRMVGSFSDQKSWVGSGQANASGKRLYDLPFLADILRIVNFDFVTLPDNTQTGHINCRIADQVVALERARFEGPGINLEGKGKIGFDGLCDMSFDLELIKWLDSIPIIGDIVSFGRGMLWKSVRVQGPIEDPTATVENYISELLPSEPDSGRRLKTKPLKTGTDESKSGKESGDKP